MNEGSRRTIEELRKLLLLIQEKAILAGQLSEGAKYFTDELNNYISNKALDI
jgi:hypothetical protein